MTLDLDEDTADRMRRAAKASGLSQSRWLAELVRQAVYALDTNSVSLLLQGRGRVGERLLANPFANVALPCIKGLRLEDVC